MSDNFIAVIDVGKTNKKVAIFDKDLKLIENAHCSFDEYSDNGVHFERIEESAAWLMNQVSSFAKKYAIQAVSITTHGSTPVCLDSSGNLAIPPVAYTTDGGEAFDKAFFTEFGSPDELQRTTGTAQVGSMINEARLLYFCKRTWPDKFATIDKILQYPQYLGYLFTGKYGAEPTYLGCHTYLLDMEKHAYSSVAHQLGIVGKMPQKIAKSWEVLGTVKADVAAKTGLSTSCIVTMGVHDSNSSLLPYLVKGYKNFALNSTGTWCVAMHPTSGFYLANNEIGKLVFFNLDVFFNPVKTSIFMGGLEFETYTTLLQTRNSCSALPAFDAKLYARIISEKKLFILPSVVKGTGIFPAATPRVIENGTVYTLDDIRQNRRAPEFFSDFPTAHAVLNISLALQTRAAFNMAGFTVNDTIFTEGGFRKNKGYNAVLAALYPKCTTVLTNLSEATAFGAALLARAALDKTTPMETAKYFEINTTEVPKTDLGSINHYADAFTKLI